MKSALLRALLWALLLFGAAVLATCTYILSPDLMAILGWAMIAVFRNVFASIWSLLFWSVGFYMFVGLVGPLDLIKRIAALLSKLIAPLLPGYTPPNNTPIEPSKHELG